jgi:hypothetical protein
MTAQNISAPAFDTELRAPHPHISDDLARRVDAFPGARPTAISASKQERLPRPRAGGAPYQRHSMYADWLRGDAQYTASLVLMGLLALLIGFWREIAAFLVAALAPSWGKFTGLCASISLVAGLYPWLVPLYLRLKTRRGRLMAQLKVRHLT